MEATVTNDFREVKRYLAQTTSPVITDIETTSLTVGHGQLLCIAFAPYDREDVLVWWPELPEDIAKLRLRKMVAHNAPFELRWLKSYGAKVACVWDTMFMAHLLEEEKPKGLKDLGERILGYKDWSDDNVADFGTEFGQHWEDRKHIAKKAWAKSKKRVSEYVAKDVHVTRELMKWQVRHCKRKLKPGEDPIFVMKKLMIPAIEPLTQMEINRMPVRLEAVKKERARVEKAIQEIEQELDASIPPKIDTCDECSGKGYLGRSPEQGKSCKACAGLGEIQIWPDFLMKTTPKWGNTNWTKWWLYVYQGATCPRRTKPTKAFPEGNPGLSQEDLGKIKHPAAKLLSQRALLNKNLTGFLVPIGERTVDGRIPTSFKLTGTVTGRLSSSSPSDETPGINTQQIPRDRATRNLFGEAKGSGLAWIEADFSQLELRVAARMANDKTMIGLFETGEDIHTYIAGRLLPGQEITKQHRTLAKGVNFGFLYGMQAKHFAEYLYENYGVTITQQEAYLFREEFFRTFNGLEPWYRKQRAFALEHGGVPNAFGRFRHLPRVYHNDFWIRESAFRQAINSPVQGTGSDFMLISLAQLARDTELQRLGAKLITTVHDSVCLVAPYKTAKRVGRIVKRTMEQADAMLDEKYFLKADITISRVWGGEALAEF